MSSQATTSRNVALVTGGSRGIGFGIATELARCGFDVAINGRREEQHVGDSLKAVTEHGAATIYCRGDVIRVEDRQSILQQVRDRFGRLDVLVNNAGVAPMVRADILEATDESFDRVVATNLKGPYFLTQAAAKWMIEMRRDQPDFRGCIVNISSVSATVPAVNRGDYCISKAGVAMATKLWAARLAEFNIDVFEVRPGIIETDMTAGVKQRYDQLVASDALLEKRWGTPQDVGRAVAMLARGELAYATGQVLVLDGGLTLQRF